ncbi:hypothetical protein JCM10213_006536 [Rhodosporidiobolus nylandii]
MSAHSAHTSYPHNAGSAPAFSGSTREGLATEGNTSAAGGSHGNFTGNAGNDFSLRGIEKNADRESDLTVPNSMPGESLSTAGPGGDYKHTQLQEHEKKGLKQRLERDDEREDREARGYDEPITKARQPTDHLI